MIVWMKPLAALAATMIAIAIAASPAVAQSAPQSNAPAAQQVLGPEELDQLVAPIALYPDNLLSEVLMAATYPLEVVQADRWATENKNLKGDALNSAVQKLTWDESVKSLLATPSVLTMMSTKLDWTQKLGDTVLAQQPDLMDAIQRLRSKAQANNKLTSTKEQKVEVRQEQNKQVIVIEPTVPDTVYVPYYDPGVVYGAWPYPAYPPYYFPAPGYIAGGIIATGIAFGAGYAVGRWASGGNYWGGGVNWGGNNIYANRSVNINNVGNSWQHNPVHRHGVKYTNQNVAQKFSNNNLRAGAQDRLDYRGRGGEQVLRPSGDRGPGDRGPGDRGPGDRSPGDRAGNLGDRGPGDRGPGDRGPGDRGAGDRVSGDRAALGDRGPANRPGAGDRSPGDRRPEAGNRPAQGGGRPSRDNAFSNVQSGKAANLQSHRGQASLGGGGGGGARAAAAAGGGGGGMRAAGGGGGGARAAAAGRGGGGGGGGGRGGGRR